MQFRTTDRGNRIQYRRTKQDRDEFRSQAGGTMKTSAAELVEQIKSRPESFFVARSERNYDLFLDLYEQVGYAPRGPDEIARWKERSRTTWNRQDSTLPGSYTGGLVEGQIVS